MMQEILRCHDENQSSVSNALRGMMDRWVGKVALVTGASAGIGEAIAKALVGAGMNVLAVARREEKLRDLSKSLEKSKGTFHYARCDVRNEQDILDTFAYAERELGGVDVLVNNAGIARHQPISASETEDLRAVLDVNVLAVAICTREAIKSMRKRQTEGHIFNINSVLGKYANMMSQPIGLYPASKFALRAMTENLKQEITANKDPIRVTAIHPGLVKTEIVTASGLSDDLYKVLPFIESEHIADCLLFALGQPPIVQLDEITVAPLHQKL